MVKSITLERIAPHRIFFWVEGSGDPSPLVVEEIEAPLPLRKGNPIPL